MNTVFFSSAFFHIDYRIEVAQGFAIGDILWRKLWTQEC